MSRITKLNQCRICASPLLEDFLSLGEMPIPNGFLAKEDLTKDEPHYPLDTCLCLNCGLMQLRHIVSAETMFRNYLYIPSASQTRLQFFSSLVKDIDEKVRLSEKTLVVDIGSNDGSLLTAFRVAGAKILGVDPAENLVTVAELNGIPSMLGYFTVETAKKIKKKYGPATVMTATNVFAHIADLPGFMKGIETLIADDGIFVAHFPYVMDLVEQNQFDTIYHEHLSYFSLKPLIQLTEDTDLEICDILRHDLDGGSLRVYWKKKGNTKIKTNKKDIKALLSLEEEKELYAIKTFQAFAKRVRLLRDDVRKKLYALKKKNKSIVGYGAAAKGNVLLNYFSLGTDVFDYLVDSTPYKQGLYTPGTHVPIFPETHIFETQPSYVLILAWNFADEIVKKNSEYTKNGGKFLVAIPKLQTLA